MRKSGALALVAAMLLAAAAAQAETKTIALTGQSAPGTGGGTFSVLYAPTLNASGQAAFFSFLTGTSDGSTYSIFLGSGGGPTAIAREKWSAPGTGGGTFYQFGFPSLNASGQAAFLASLTGTSDDSDQGIFRGDGSTSTAIAREKWSAPGTGGGTFYSFYAPVLNASGQAAFYANLTGTDDGSNQGIFRGNGSTLVAIARQYWAAPGTGGGTFGYFGDPALNASGQAAFYAYLTGTDDGSTYGIFRGSGGGLTAIAREKWSAPGTGGGTFSYLYAPALNASGQAAFYAYLTGTADGSTYGIFRGDGSTTMAIAREKWSAPGTGGGTFYYFHDPALNASGQEAFYADLTGTADGSTNGIFRGDGSTLVAIARQKWSAPGTGGGTFSSFGYPSLNASGQEAFYADLSGTAGGSTDNAGIFLADDQERIVAVRKGNALEGSTITGLSFLGGTDPGGQSGLNDYGQVAYKATLADGRQGNFLFTPELHWRASGSGPWDTAANWTVGLAPAAVHPVTIDPSSSLTVTGPTQADTIKTLTVGAKTYGQTATLNLASATGALTVTGAAAVQAAGCLNVSAGTFAAPSLTNAGTFLVDVAGAASLGSLVNTGSATVGGAVTVSGGVENDGTMTVQSVGVLTAASGLTNLGSLNLQGATLAGGTVTNDYGGMMNAKGTVSSALENNGSLSLTGVLWANGLVTNRGTLSASSGQNLRENGGLENYGTISLSGGAVSGNGALNNYGTIDLSGGAVSGPGTLTNKAGGLLSGSGAVSAAFVNQGGIEVPVFSTLAISQAFANSGDITLLGANSVLSGGTVTNTGTIRSLGSGRIGNGVTNSAGGAVRAEGGIFTLGGTTTNAVGGILEIMDSATILVSKGLATNSGSIILRGGALDNNGHTMINAGSITGHGTLRSGGLTNNVGKNIGVGGYLDVIGPATNNGTVTTPAGCITTFYGFVNGNGLFPETGTVMFLGGYSPGGSPGEAEFGGDLTLGGAGALVMELAGELRGAQYDAIRVDGTLALGGTLDVDLLYGFRPQAGQTFDILDFDPENLSGRFSAFDLPDLGGGLSWDTSNLYTTGALGVVPEPATLALVGLGLLAAIRRKLSR